MAAGFNRIYLKVILSPLAPRWRFGRGHPRTVHQPKLGASIVPIRPILRFYQPLSVLPNQGFGEQAVRDANDVPGSFVTLVLRPRFIWGPGDQTLLPIILKTAATGRWAWIDGGRKQTSTTYIENLVDAHRAGFDCGHAG
jgi:hypothetical protein